MDKGFGDVGHAFHVLLIFRVQHLGDLLSNRIAVEHHPAVVAVELTPGICRAEETAVAHAVRSALRAAAPPGLSCHALKVLLDGRQLFPLRHHPRRFIFLPVGRDKAVEREGYPHKEDD
ncbi:hypothetical protein [Pseudoxanthomonas mexicana]|uniref:hypothetical protein n=1 Tax=Pseudoxanthomonas mexicana TaxID=128785 RepID=UPI00398B485E